MVTLRQEMEARLCHLGLTPEEAQECVQLAVQAGEADKEWFNKYYSVECWEKDVFEFSSTDRSTDIFDGHVLGVAFKWLLNRKNTLESTLTEIHRLSDTSL